MEVLLQLYEHSGPVAVLVVYFLLQRQMREGFAKHAEQIAVLFERVPGRRRGGVNHAKAKAAPTD